MTLEFSIGVKVKPITVLSWNESVALNKLVFCPKTVILLKFAEEGFISSSTSCLTLPLISNSLFVTVIPFTVKLSPSTSVPGTSSITSCVLLPLTLTFVYL